MANPIDIIANAMRVADGNHTMGAGQLAEVAANALTDARIVSNATQAFLADGWGVTPNGEELQAHTIIAICRTVLRSAGGS